MKTPHHQKSRPKHHASAIKKHPSDMEMHDPHFIIPPLQPGDPKPAALEKIKPPHVAIFLATRHPVLQVPSTRNPAPDKSFGYVGRFVKIADSDWKTPGTLVIRINKDGLGAVAAETLRVFRWNPAEYGYELIHRSALGQSRDYVWALIHEPGIYAVIGVNVDPLVLRTLVLLRSMRDLLPAMGTDRKLFQKRICELFICNPELRRRINDVKFVRSIVEENLRRGLPGRWPGGIPPKRSKEFYDKLCKTCSALGNPSSPPELAILPEAAMGLPADVGEWSSVPLGINGAEILAVHAALILTGKVLYFAGSEHDENQHDTGQVNHTREWNPATNAIQAAGSPTHDLFCCGHAFLKNGKLVAAGGTQKWPDVSDPTTHYAGLRNTTIFNPSAPINTPWTAAAMMNFQRGTTQGGGRWYPTLVTLPNGRLFTMSGYPEETDTRDNNIMVEVFNMAPTPLGSWADLGDQVKSPLFYPRLHVLPDGTVFCSTPMGTKCKKCDPATGVWTDVCASPGNMYTGFLTTAVLLPLLPSNNYKPCILFVGHSQPKIIDLSVATPVWQNTGPRALAGNPIRNHACAILLPNGKVLVTGGSKTSLDADAVLAAECYDPVTNSWETMASAAVPRLYHSVALLIPDGRIWSCGSNFNCGGGVANRELRMEQYKPPYLFLGGTKPVITNAPTTLSTIPGTFVIQTPQANDIQSVVMIRCGSVTHAFDADQRYVGLVIPSRTATSLTVQTPPNRKIAPPGYYMLFIIHTNGVPSVGKFIRINV